VSEKGLEGEPLVGVHLQQHLRDRLELVRYPFGVLESGPLGELLLELDNRVGFERRPVGHHVVKHGAHAPQVGSGVVALVV
jgi:hypothetical protein